MEPTSQGNCAPGEDKINHTYVILPLGQARTGQKPAVAYVIVVAAVIWSGSFWLDDLW